MGGGTRSRHAYSLGLELGLPTGILAAMGAFTALQNAHLMQMLLAKHGGILTSFEEFEKLPCIFELAAFRSWLGCRRFIIGKSHPRLAESPQTEPMPEST